MDNARRIDRRIILFPLPLQGHINPMLHLADIFHAKGFSVAIVHSKLNSPKPENRPQFSFRPIEDGIEGSCKNVDLLSLLTALNERCVGPFREALVELLEDGSAGPVAGVVSDAMLYFTGGVCRSLRIPRIVLRTGGACSFLAYAAFPMLREKGYLPIQESRLEETVSELPPLRVKDLPAIESPHPEKLYEVLENMARETKSSSGLIFNTFEELEESSLIKIGQDFRIPIFPIGPFHKHFPSPSSSSSSSSSLIEEDRASISWLDGQSPRSVVYVSFGSVAALEEEKFLEVARGLADGGHPFLWVVRPGSVRGHEWLGPLPGDFLGNLEGRCLIVKWAPQLEVLAHPSIGVFWTHCGWNSTLESICEGVPMICTPCFTDQLVNARHASHVWRVGIVLGNKDSSHENIEAAVKRAMEEREFGQEIREMALDLKAKASYCLKPGGSSYEHLKRLVRYIALL